MFDNDMQVAVSRATNKVSAVHILSNKYKTNRGISVGSSAEYVKKIYGEPSDIMKKGEIPEESNSYAYEYYYRGEKQGGIMRF